MCLRELDIPQEAVLSVRGILADIGAELGGILHAIFNLNVNR